MENEAARGGQKYGAPDVNGRLGLYFTMSRIPDSSGLFLYIESKSISVRHVSGEMAAEWEIQTLAERFTQKLPSLILVSAFSEMRGDQLRLRGDTKEKPLSPTSTSAAFSVRHFFLSLSTLDDSMRQSLRHRVGAPLAAPSGNSSSYDPVNARRHLAYIEF